jgi:hypothetical protein
MSETLPKLLDELWCVIQTMEDERRKDVLVDISRRMCQEMIRTQQIDFGEIVSDHRRWLELGTNFSEGVPS